MVSNKRRHLKKLFILCIITSAWQYSEASEITGNGYFYGTFSYGIYGKHLNSNMLDNSLIFDYRHKA